MLRVLLELRQLLLEFALLILHGLLESADLIAEIVLQGAADLVYYLGLIDTASTRRLLLIGVGTAKALRVEGLLLQVWRRPTLTTGSLEETSLESEVSRLALWLKMRRHGHRLSLREVRGG